MFESGLEITPFTDFESASRAVLSSLHERLGFGLWMMTRTEGSEWIVLQAEDHGYDVEEGTVFNWADSFCSKMVLGLGPRIAPNSDDIPAYLEAPIGRQVKIGSYIGIPVRRDDGSLFGTLCAIDPEPKTPELCNELPWIELMARLLGTILERDLREIEQARLLEQSQLLSCSDALTGLKNRRGWNESVESEESRARRYGGRACVIMIDLDDLKVINDTLGHAEGDLVIQRAARLISKSVRETDVVARIGGDEFAVLALECDDQGAETLLQQIRSCLACQGVQASVGKALRNFQKGFPVAIREADKAMYEDKARRKSERMKAEFESAGAAVSRCLVKEL